MELLIIGHGSRSTKWNQEILTVVEEMNEQRDESSCFEKISPCFLEHAQPGIQKALEEITSQKKDVLALPLFLSVATHVLSDIPEEIGAVCEFEKQDDIFQIYHINGQTVYLLQPPETPELIAENCCQRFENIGEPRANMLLVYYGSKKHVPAWNELGNATVEAIKKRLPNIKVDFEFGGDLVDFSEQPIQKKIAELCRDGDRVAIIPALVAVGVIQTEVIPKAIEASGHADRVIYQNDAILPDPKLAGRILGYAELSCGQL